MNTHVTGTTIQQLRDMGHLYYHCNQHGLFKKKIKFAKAGFRATQSPFVDAKKLQPITYAPMNHHYLVPGEKVGQAFHDGLALK